MKKIKVLLGICLFSSYLFSKDIVITSIQPLYSLACYLTKNTDIEVYSAFGSDVSMSMSKEEIDREDFNLEIAKESQAVIDIAKVWNNDSIYRKARNYNIHIIEIDASYPYYDNMPSLFFNNYSNGEINPYIWTGTKNIIKMANIISADLIRIYPKYKKEIEKNLIIFTNEVRTLEKEGSVKIFNCDNPAVIALTENLQYLLNDLNIYTDYIDYSFINKDNIQKILTENNIKVVVSDRWVKKDILDAIKQSGGKFVLLDTLDIPYDSDEKMDKDALLKAYENNVNKLVKSLSSK